MPGEVKSLPVGWNQTEVAWQQLPINTDRGFSDFQFIFRTVLLHKDKSLGCMFVHLWLCQRTRSADLAFCIRKVALSLAQVRPCPETRALWPSSSNHWGMQEYNTYQYLITYYSTVQQNYCMFIFFCDFHCSSKQLKLLVNFFFFFPQIGRHRIHVMTWS